MTPVTDQSAGARIWAVIPARGGSQGISRKNLQVVAGASLVTRAVRACVAARRVDRVVVTTDDPEIAAQARRAGAEVVDRPAEIAGALATSESAVLHALAALTDGGADQPDITAMVQCTSPFVTADDVDATVEAVDTGDGDSALTVAPSHAFLWRDGGAGATPVAHDLANRQMRQELEPQYAEAGSVYAMRTAGLIEHEHRFFGQVAFHVVDHWRAIQIDDPADLEAARALAPLLDEGRSVWLPDPVRAVALDFDGVLTDDRVITHQDGTESIVAHRGDGLGVERLLRAGIAVFVLSKEANPVVAARCHKLGIPYEQGLDDKEIAFRQLIEREEFDPHEVIFVGNDVNDLGCLAQAGCGVAVADAHPEVREAADIVLTRLGGQGAVRELSDLILQNLDPASTRTEDSPT